MYFEQRCTVYDVCHVYRIAPSNTNANETFISPPKKKTRIQNALRRSKKKKSRKHRDSDDSSDATDTEESSDDDEEAGRSRSRRKKAKKDKVRTFFSQTPSNLCANNEISIYILIYKTCNFVFRHSFQHYFQCNRFCPDFSCHTTSPTPSILDILNNGLYGNHSHIIPSIFPSIFLHIVSVCVPSSCLRVRVSLVYISVHVICLCVLRVNHSFCREIENMNFVWPFGATFD